MLVLAAATELALVLVLCASGAPCPAWTADFGQSADWPPSPELGRRGFNVSGSKLISPSADLPGKEARRRSGKVKVVEVEAGNVVSELQIGVPVVQAADLGAHDQRLDLAVHSEVLAGTRAVELCLLQPLDLDFTDGFGDPFRRLRLGRLHEDFGSGLGEHDLRQMTIDHLKLGLALESKHERVLALPVLGDGGVELRELLQAGQLVDHKPYRLLSRLRCA